MTGKSLFIETKSIQRKFQTLNSHFHLLINMVSK